MTRRPLPRVEFARLLLDQNGECPVCARKLRAENIHDDHILALARGGGNEIENRRLICSECHAEKTHGRKATSLGSDIHEIAKTRRLASGGRKRKGRKIQGPGFRKDVRRKINGTVEKVES